jgi:hypothetical protein
VDLSYLQSVQTAQMQELHLSMVRPTQSICCNCQILTIVAVGSAARTRMNSGFEQEQFGRWLFDLALCKYNPTT